MIILDTNVVSALMKSRPDNTLVDWLDRQPDSSVWTTSITVLECRYGIASLPGGRRRDGLEEAFDNILVDDLDSRVIGFERADAEAASVLMARRRALGRPGYLRDTMIAGIAITRKARLITRNTRHFDDAGIDLIDPWHP